VTTQSSSPVNPKPFPWVRLFVLLGLTALGVAILSLQGAEPPPPDPPRFSDSPWEWTKEKWTKAKESWTGEAQEREEAAMRSQLQKNVGGLLAVSALVYLTLLFFGAPITEWVRARLAERLSLGRTAQRDLAVAAFTVTCCAVVGLVFYVSAYSYARVSAIILLGGAAYPFVAKVLPGISRQDAELRQAGLREVKAILAVLAIALLAFHLLDGGLGGVVDPTAGG
jgi:hypothetical protein